MVCKRATLAWGVGRSPTKMGKYVLTLFKEDVFTYYIILTLYVLTFEIIFVPLHHGGGFFDLVRRGHHRRPMANT